jgi:hypothetical protein
VVAQNKKIWQRPELTILVRNTPEESVLATCKEGSIPAAPQTSDIGCKTRPVFCEPDEFCCCGCNKLNVS